MGNPLSSSGKSIRRDLSVLLVVHQNLCLDASHVAVTRENPASERTMLEKQD